MSIKTVRLRRRIRWLLLAASAALSLLGLVGCGPGVAQLRAVQYAPVERSDWLVSTPAEQGLDPLLVAKLYHDARELETLYGLLVIKNDRLIAEKYFNGSSISHSNDRMSATKSVVSALTGVALKNGCLQSLDQKMVDFFPEQSGTLGDPRKSQVTIRHLLQMRAGYPWESHEPYFYNVMFEREDWNWIRHMSDFPLLHSPGTTFGYSNLTSHILGAAIARACDTDLLSFARRALFEPMGAELPQWHRASDNYYFGSFGLFTPARDMAKFGKLYLHEGEFDGKRILPAEWVRASFQRYSTGINWTGWFGSKLGSYFSDLGYGFQWWSATVGDHYVDFAWGHGGNLIVLLRDLNMIVVTAADPLYRLSEEAAWEYEGDVIDLVGEFIDSLPARG